MRNIDDEVRKFWNRVAADWEIQVGDDGDSNRILNSDPVLWQFLGDVKDLVVLDAGCGTGYLSRKLAAKGAVVTGIDLSEKMIEIARTKSVKIAQSIDFIVDSCSKLEKVTGNYFDVVVTNYVLMDVPDLQGTMIAFNRVLKVNGRAILIFSHPCFPQGRATVLEDSTEVSYTWNFSYFEQKQCVDPPWGHFNSEFIWFHRPLSDYWKAFKSSGFEIVDFEEPRIAEERVHLAENERKLRNSKIRPYSVAFQLQKVRNN
jgi:ubiquinone/menaquinone biosynthesis C-methylase UbiE